MARAQNAVETKWIKISTTPLTRAYLNDLVRTGLFGKTPSEVAEQFVRERVRDLIKEDWIKKRSR